MSTLGDYCLVLVFLPSFLLHGVGFFTPNWIIESEDITFGLFYRCGSNGTTCFLLEPDNQYINKHAVGLQASALVMLFLSCISVICIINFLRDDNVSTSLTLAVCRLFGCLLVFLYPIAGVCISVGCILTIADHYKVNVGYSFFLSIGAASYIIIKCIVIVVCCFYCKSGAKDIEDEEMGEQRGSQSNLSRNDPEKTADTASEGHNDRRPGLSAVVAAVRMKQLIRLNK